MLDIEEKLSDIYTKGTKFMQEALPGPAMLILITWNLIEWLICLVTGRGIMLWLAGGIMDAIVNCAVILFLINKRGLYDCWIWAGIITIFNAIPCLFPLTLGNGYLVDIIVIFIQIFVVCLGDIIGNIVIILVMRRYPLDYDIRDVFDTVIKKIQQKTQPAQEQQQEQQGAEPEDNPFVGGFSPSSVPQGMDFGGFGGLNSEAQQSIEPPVEPDDEDTGGFGGDFS